MLSRFHSRWPILPILFLALMVPLLTACPEPRAVDKAKQECIEFAIENAEDAYDVSKECSEDILEACLDHTHNQAEKDKCYEEHEQRLKEADDVRKQVEREKRDFITEWFSDTTHIEEWLKADSDQRAEIKKKFLDLLISIARALTNPLSFHTGGDFDHRVEQGAINAHVIDNLLPSGSTLQVMAHSVGAGVPQPYQPVSITFTLDPDYSGAWVTFTQTQYMTLAGSYALLFVPETAQPGAMQIEVLDVALTGGSLHLGAVSSGHQYFTLDPHVAARGRFDGFSGQVDLFVPLQVDNALLPPATAAVGMTLTGFLQAFTETSQLMLAMSVPMTEVFEFREPASPVSATVRMGPSGGRLMLDSLTGLDVPPGALTDGVSVTLGLYPTEVLHDACALPAEPGDVPLSRRCIALAFEADPDGLMLAAPATLSMYYNIGLFADMDLERVLPYEYRPEDGQWTPIVTFTHDVSSQVIGFPVGHFSLYGLGAPNRFVQYLPLVIKGE